MSEPKLDWADDLASAIADWVGPGISSPETLAEIIRIHDIPRTRAVINLLESVDSMGHHGAGYNSDLHESARCVRKMFPEK